MKKLLQMIIWTVLTLGQSSVFAEESGKRYEVTVTNLTRGQIMSPLVAATHNRDYQLFQRGAPASAGLAAVAQDADNTILVNELQSSTTVFDVVEASAGIPPGGSETIVIHSRGNKRWLSLVSMMVSTNDGFIALNGVRLPRRKEAVTHIVPAYDAGSEDNNESCEYIPGPPCGNAFKESGLGGEGYVHIHAGIHSQGDPAVELDAATHDWRNPVASIRIRRID